ncbi:MAG: hypothetical protein NT047_01875 [Deltaproteobacteria bacterium]|nr:hypothetical protein [Deltaproteobacteria bacterium]
MNCTTRRIDPPCRSCRMGKPAICENMAEGRLAPGMFLGICREVGGIIIYLDFVGNEPIV